MIDEVTASLLENACPSIRCRMRTEILGQSSSDGEVVSLQKEILEDDLVREVMEWKGSDNWKCASFHGANGIEAGVRILCEKGVSRTHPVITSALDAMRKYPDIIERGIGKPGRYLDAIGLGGSELIRAVVFAYAGAEDEPCVEEQTKVVLEAFKFIRSVNTIKEVTNRYRDKLVFKPGVAFPSIYHLRLLAFTGKWKTPANRRLVTEGVKKLVALSPIPYILARKGAQLIAPASFAMLDFRPRMESLKDAEWMMWFHRMELLSRMGMIQAVPELKRQVMELEQMLQQGGGWFTKKLSSRYFLNWGAYSGLSLERDWRSPERRIRDLTFRSLLIKSPA
jgi:hypothetical protein